MQLAELDNLVIRTFPTKAAKFSKAVRICHSIYAVSAKGKVHGSSVGPYRFMHPGTQRDVVEALKRLGLLSGEAVDAELEKLRKKAQREEIDYLFEQMKDAGIEPTEAQRKLVLSAIE